MADKSAAYLWYPRDFASDEYVILMDLATEGAYRRLLDHQWLHGSVPSDMKSLAKICKGVSISAMRRMWSSIAPCFHPLEGDPNRMINIRLERVRSHWTDIQKARSEAGKKGGRPPSNGKQTESKPKANRKPAVPIPIPIPNLTTTTTPYARETVTQYDDESSAPGEPLGEIPPELTPDARTSLGSILRASHRPEALLAEVRMILAGGRPNVPPDPAAVSQAVTDIAITGDRVTGVMIRSFVQRAARDLAAPSKCSPRRPGPHVPGSAVAGFLARNDTQPRKAS